MFKSRINGFASVMALLFLQLSAVFALYEMMQSTDEMRQVKQAKFAVQHTANTILVMRRIEHDLVYHSPDCEIPLTAQHDFLQRPHEWWLRFACSYRVLDQAYYYVLENLGNDPCAYIKNEYNNQYVTPEYYRVTLYSLVTDQAMQNKIILQSTLAKAAPQRLSCASGSHQHEVYSGSQMTRLLTGLRNIPWHSN